MKFLIITTDYPEFLETLRKVHPGLEHESYERQIQVRNDSLFGVADHYSHNLRKLGHEAEEIFANNEPLQRAWAASHAVPVSPARKALNFRWRRNLVPWLSFSPDRKWFYEILAAQIKHHRPDILLVQDITIRPDFLCELKSSVGLLMGQSAAPLPKGQSLRCYDLMISSLPNYVETFRQLGLKAELQRLAFDPRVLTSLPPANPAIPVSFIGTVSRSHSERIEWLTELSSHRKIEMWGHGFDRLPGSSPLRHYYKGKAWGLEMYRLLQDSKITLNRHIGIAGEFANNLRLFEATGVGTLLLTDWKRNLPEIFEAGKEVVAYRSPDECNELIQYYLDHEEERTALAKAGQARTLHDHNYNIRMQELVNLVRKYLP